MQTALSEIVFDIKFTPSLINFNETEFSNSINSVIEPVKNLGNDVTKEVLTVTLANLRKFQKQISDRRIAIVKDIKAPITDFEAKIKKGDAEIEQYINKYDANLKVILAKEKVAKHTEIEKLLPRIIENNKLNAEYAKQLTILEEYYLVKWSMAKITVDLIERAEALFKQQDYARVQEELRNTQIESRTRLIEQLNAEYNLEFSYATFPITNYDDITMRQRYTEISAKKISAKKEIEEAEKALIPVIDSSGEQIGQVTKTHDDGKGNITAEIKLTEKISHASDPEFPGSIIENPHMIWGILNEPAVYQNLRLGAGSQADILSAVAKLKASGLYVEFIE
jgi:hypothetical protein